jgi:hypothetical protein
MADLLEWHQHVGRLSPYHHDNIESKTSDQNKKKWDPNLRSSKFVTGQKILATDGELGHVDDFIIDDETWAIRYLIIETGNWWEGKKVLVSPQWIDSINAEEPSVSVNLPAKALSNLLNIQKKTC